MLVSALQTAESKGDVRRLLAEYGYEPVNAAWGQLDDLTKSSLSLVKAFDGQVLHDIGSEPNAVREQQAHPCRAEEHQHRPEADGDLSAAND